jgi:class 3 adenylate cyclase/tetratricopeptide (TPR) repeat protein
MVCPKCRSENLPDSVFCTECGASLTGGCPACGSDNPSGARFCRKCRAELLGAGFRVQGSTAEPRTPSAEPRNYTPRHLIDKVLTSRSAMEGERKQVTVLFADVKGSLELAGQVDPEEWHRIMDSFFSILTQGVHRFEGTINQYTGDGVMALFGAPIAHEDHAQRACYAALHLGDELRRYADDLRVRRSLNFSVRMGLNSGEVVVGKIGDDLRMDYTAYGQTVGIAARVQQIAAPDRAYLTGATARLAEGFFDLRDLGWAEVKGTPEPIHVFELVGIGRMRTRFEVSRARGLTRFVGRRSELATLETALDRAREGDSQLVGIVGEPGVGKSRLCYEFAERCRARGIEVYEGRCLGQGSMVPYLPVLQIFRAYFRLGDDERDRTARDKVAGRLLQLGEQFREAVPVLFDLLGIADPEAPTPRVGIEIRQRQLLEIARRLYASEAERRPVVTILEDLHWADSASEALISALFDAMHGTRTMVVVNFRPEYQAPWMNHSFYESMPLRPLGREDSTQLLRELLGTDESTGELLGLVHEKSRGNPFFIEEIVQELVETGVLQGRVGAYVLAGELGELRVPNSVQAVLAARIDRLADLDKRVLQTAAVIGKQFTETLMDTVLEEPHSEVAAALGSLIRAEFVHQDALYPTAHYSFKHPLTQEVAYGSVLNENRGRIHAKVAARMGEVYGDNPGEHAALIAHHWEAAGETLEAARWCCRAAEWLQRREAGEAFQYWSKARALLERLPQSEEAMRMALDAGVQALLLGNVVGISDVDAAALFKEGRELAERAHDTRALAMILQGFAIVNWNLGNLAGAVDQGIEAYRLAMQTNDRGLINLTQATLTISLFLRGDLDEALTTNRRTLLDLAEDPSAIQPLAGFSAAAIAGHQGMLLGYVGRLAEAVQALDRATEAAQKTRDAQALGFIGWWRADLQNLIGDSEAAIQEALHAIEHANRMGNHLVHILSARALGLAHLRLGRSQQALDVLRRGLEIATEHNFVAEAGTLLGTLAEAWLAAGNNDEARQTAERALAEAEKRGARVREVEASISLARVLLRTDGIAARERIEALMRHAGELTDSSRARTFEPFILLEEAELARLLGNEDARRKHTAEAKRLFDEIGAVGHARALGSR